MRTAISTGILLSVLSGAALALEPPAALTAEPDYVSASPRYCLLTFGLAVEKTVWLVHDGRTLYVDRNGNGDVTEPGENVTAGDGSNADQGVYMFSAGDIAEGDLLHKDLRVYCRNLDHLREGDERVREHLESDPDARFYHVSLQVEIPGRRGNGIGGRVMQMASYLDLNGCLVFSPNRDDAPIINFRGPWEVTLWEPPKLRIGRQTDVYLGVGTPGRGPGTTAFYAWEELIPPDVSPVITATFASSDPDAPPVRELYEIKGRC